MSNYKLSAPLLEGTIPPFYKNSSGGIDFSIPFTMNRAVSWNEISGFKIKVKSVISGREIFTSPKIDKSTEQNSIIIYSANGFNDKFHVGQFYKIQLAYISNEGIEGYYSSVAILKCTTKPTVYINNLEVSKVNSHCYDYTGVYDQSENGDQTEKVYSYRFNLYNMDEKLLFTSGDILHSVLDDDFSSQNISYDHHTIISDLGTGIYLIEYQVKTISGLEVASPKYRIQQKQLIEPDTKFSVLISKNYENGYVNISLQSDEKEKYLSSGFFIVSRTSEDSDFLEWEEIYRFHIMTRVINKQIYKDFTVEQGKTYRYSVQQYNNKDLRSKRILSRDIYVDFENAFLTDGKRQLKIKYNPKVSSFKRNVLETKVDTIGGAYPFIFRNGRVSYNEFPISGLISYLSDNENLFLTSNIYKKYPREDDENIIDLSGNNMIKERIFKMEVLEWLSNGEPKIFRSPTEGNFIVRLMNSSLTPNDTLGRMIHTFNSTAYEISEFNYENLKKYNIINLGDESFNTLFVQTIEFLQKDYRGEIIGYRPKETSLLPPNRTARTVKFFNMTPGEIVKIKFVGQNEFERIQIGVTGTYLLDTGTYIQDIRLEKESNGSMEYTYDYTQLPSFESIDTVEITDVPLTQFIGEHDIFQEITQICLKEIDDSKGVKLSTKSETNFNKQPHFIKEYDTHNLRLYPRTNDEINNKIDPICYTYKEKYANIPISYESLGLKWVKNPKIRGVNFYKISVEKRPIHQVIVKSKDKYLDDLMVKVSHIPNQSNNISKEDFLLDTYFIKIKEGQYKIALNYNSSTTYYKYKFNDPYYIYQLITIVNGEYKTIGYYDVFNHTYSEKYDSKIWIGNSEKNKEELDVNDIGNIEITLLNDVEFLKSSNGVIVNVSYSLGNAVYNIENIASQNITGDFTQPLYKAKNNYTTILNDRNAALNSVPIEDGKKAREIKLNRYPQLAKVAYDLWGIQLIRAQQEEKRQGGYELADEDIIEY